jgi:hypothetical protein
MITSKELLQIKKAKLIHYIWYAILSMNFSGLEELLDDDIDYEDIGKEEFILKLKNRFSEDIIAGDTEYTLDFSSCNACNCNEAVCVFTGNNSKRSFALYFDFKNDTIVDIYHCNFYSDQDIDPYDDLPMMMTSNFITQ